MIRRLDAYLLVAAASFLMAGCNEVVAPPPPPPHTAYTMEAVLNGEEWKAILPTPNAEGDTLKAVAGYDPTYGVLYMVGLHWPNWPDTADVSVMMFVAGTSLEPGVISLGGVVVDSVGEVHQAGAAAFADSRGERAWGTDESHGGEIFIDRVDREHRALVGRFMYTAVSPEDGTTLVVRNGGFVCKLDVNDPAVAIAMRSVRSSAGVRIQSAAAHQTVNLAAQAAALVKDWQLR